MSNSYYNHTTYPATGAFGTSANLRAELDSITAGFALLPTLGANALQLVAVNASSNALQTLSGVTGDGAGGLALTGAFAAASINSTPIGQTTKAAGAFTTLSATGTISNTGVSLSGSAPATSLTLDLSGNLGVGLAPTYKLDVTVGATVGAKMFRFTGATLRSMYGYADAAGTGIANSDPYTAGVMYYQWGSVHTWYTGAVASMIIDATQNLLIGQASLNQVALGVSVQGAGGTAPGTISAALSQSTAPFTCYNLYSTGAGAYRFFVDMTGAIHATSTSITAISDATLKQNVRDLDTGLAEVLRLRPVRFDWINGDGTDVAGFISQEVQQVLPDLTAPFMYSVDANGSDVTKLGLRMGDMLPTVVKAIQELKSSFDTLAADYAAYRLGHP